MIEHPAELTRGVGSSSVIAAIGGMIVAVGAGIGTVRYIDVDSSEAAARAMEGIWGGLALGMVVAAPGVLALLALHQRPVLLLSSGIVLFPLSFISFVLVPLLLTAGLLIAAYGARSASNRLSPARTALITMSVAALLVAAVISLFVHEDPRQLLDASGGRFDQ